MNRLADPLSRPGGMKKPVRDVQPSTPEPTAKPQTETGKLNPAQRRERILKEAERRGFTTETIAMLAMVRGVAGFTDMSRVINPPSRAMIDAEQLRGAKNEGHARARAWHRVRERMQKFDHVMQPAVQYARPSDWARLFSILKAAANPSGGVPNVFTVRSLGDRAAFRRWADQHSLNGDGMVHIADDIRAMYEEVTGHPFSIEEVVPKIQAFTGDQLDQMIRAGFEPGDTYIHLGYGEGYIPMQKLPERFDRLGREERERAIRAELDRQLSASPQLDRRSAESIRDEKYRQIGAAYDRKHFDAVVPERNSVARENGIMGGIFATVNERGDVLQGLGYHGIIEPDLLKLLPPEYVHTEPSKPYIRPHDGKTVVTVNRWLVNIEGPSLMDTDEVVEQDGSGALEQAATRRIADAIVYHRRDRRDIGPWDELSEPYYWNDVHWVYKQLIEDRLPFLARVAHVDTAPIEPFADEEVEKEWMYNRILSSGVTAATQLNDRRDHFVIRLEDVYPHDPERSKLEEAALAYPDTVQLGHGSFVVNYEWNKGGTTVERAIIPVYNDHYASTNRSFALRDVSSTDIPQLGTLEHPVGVTFRYEYSQPPFSPEVTDYPADHFRELLEQIEPQDQMIQRRWYDFEGSDLGKLRIPLTVTVHDPFPRRDQLELLMAPHTPTVVYTVDRDGNEHRAYATIVYDQGDQYTILYVRNAAEDEQAFGIAQEKHAARQLAESERGRMGREGLESKLAEVHRRAAVLERYDAEFEQDNLVAFVLGVEPYTDSDRKHLQWYLDKNDFSGAEKFLGSRIQEREDWQLTIDAMRRVVATIAVLETLGFRWKNYKINRKPQGDDEYESDDGYSYVSSSYTTRDRSGFAPGDIHLNHSDIYHPSMGRWVDGRRPKLVLRRELEHLQRRLDRELELLRLKQGKLRDERAQSRAQGEEGISGPEVIYRGPGNTGNPGDEEK